MVEEETKRSRIDVPEKGTSEESAAVTPTGWDGRMEYSSSSSSRHQGGMGKAAHRCGVSIRVWWFQRIRRAGLQACSFFVGCGNGGKIFLVTRDKVTCHEPADSDCNWICKARFRSLRFRTF